jgi:hypothetical protein
MIVTRGKVKREGSADSRLTKVLLDEMPPAQRPADDHRDNSSEQRCHGCEARFVYPPTLQQETVGLIVEKELPAPAMA